MTGATSVTPARPSRHRDRPTARQATTPPGSSSPWPGRSTTTGVAPEPIPPVRVSPGNTVRPRSTPSPPEPTSSTASPNCTTCCSTAASTTPTPTPRPPLGQTSPTSCNRRPLTPRYVASKFKGAYGGDTNAPFGWGLITRWLQGRVWPNGHQDGLNALDSAWDTAASGLETLAKTVAPAREVVDEQVSDEVPQMLSQIDLVVADINTAVAQFRSLGTAGSEYADALTTAHNAIGKALSQVVIFAGIGALVGSIIGPEGTVGGGALAAGARGSGRHAGQRRYRRIG